MNNISGKWFFQEDFGFGKDIGTAFFFQENHTIKGWIEFEETIEGETPFTVKQEIKGTITDNKIDIKATSYQIIHSQEAIDYKLDDWEGILTCEGKIVGSSQDEEGACGVFVLSRTKE